MLSDCKNINYPLQVLGAYSLDPDNLKASSSGGIMSHLAESVIEEKGVVYGATLNKLRVEHIRIDNKADLNKLRGSKYLQSDVGNTFNLVAADLRKGLKVLYIGTPCIIAGLKSFLCKDYDTLILVDFVCHGIPSYKIFKDYVAVNQRNKKSLLNDVQFRCKSDGWRNYSIRWIYDKTEDIPHNKDLFFRGFMSNLYLRDSCYYCKFKNYNTFSDLTLADLWGVESVYPELDNNNQGINLILVNSDKGIDLLLKIKNKINSFNYKIESAVKYNPCITSSAKRHLFDPLFWKMQYILPVKFSIWACLLLGRIVRIISNGK